MLDEDYDHVTQVQNVKKKKGRIREIHYGTTRVDASRLSSQWFPDMAAGLDSFVSGYATQLCQEEMGSSELSCYCRLCAR